MSESIQIPLRGNGLDANLWVLLQRARSVATRARNLELTRYGVNIEQMSILHTILENGGSATVDEIASSIVRQKNSVTTLVDRMYRMGLVNKERIKSENKYRISLTSKGNELVETIPNKAIRMLFSDFDPKEKELMIKCLEQMVETGLDMLGDKYVPPFLSSKTQMNVDQQ